MQGLSPAMAASALQWWADCGVDLLVEENPRDWLKPAEPRIAPEPETARPAPDTPDTLEGFTAWLAEAGDIPFAAPGAPRLLPAGDPASGLMALVDMPAAEDLAAGSLLSGQAGLLFDRMLAAIGRDRTSIYLAPLSCLRPPAGRLGAEAERCAAIARRLIALAQPRALLIFGDGASKALLGEPMTKARGRWHEIQAENAKIRAVVTIPPSLLLKQPAHKALAWADLQLLIGGLDA